MKKYLLKILIVFVCSISLATNVVVVSAKSAVTPKQKQKIENFLIGVMHWIDVEKKWYTVKQGTKKSAKQFSDDVLIGTVWELARGNRIIKPSYYTIRDYGMKEWFVTSKQMQNFAVQLFGKKIKNGRKNYMYEKHPTYGEGYRIINADGETYVIPNIITVKKIKNGIVVIFSSAYERIYGFAGNYKAVFKTNKKSPIGYTLISIKKLKNANPTLKKAISSSHLQSNGGITYLAKNLMDNNLKTAWCEGVNGVGNGQWVKLLWKQKKAISAIEIFEGYQKSMDLYRKNGRPLKLKFEFSNGKTIIVDMENERVYQNSQWIRWSCRNMDYINDQSVSVVFLDKKIKTSYVKITVLKAKAGTKYADTCISEVKFY